MSEHKVEAPQHRDLLLERKLQRTIDSGNSVWVIGDIHGHYSTFLKLLEKIDLQEEDKLVSLGDLIDRGPDSASVLRNFRDHESLFTIRGNHEDMMLKCLSRKRNKDCKSWLKYGGIETLDSFGLSLENRDLLSDEWCEFLTRCPTEIVLDSYRLIHAGVNPLKKLDDQTNNDRLWSRDIFQFENAPDPDRQILVGHTPTQEIEGHGKNTPWKSRHKNSEGKTSVIAIDTGICLPQNDKPTLTAINLKSGEIIQVIRD